MNTKHGVRSAILLVATLLLVLVTACSGTTETATVTTTSTPTTTTTVTATATTTTTATATVTPTSTTASQTLIDQLGREVTVTGIPQRIVSLSPTNTEILFALGLQDRIVGVTDYCNYPAAATTKQSIGGYSTPNIETIVALAPDLIIADNIHEAEIIPQLEKHGLTVLGMNPTTVEDAFRSISFIGQATGQVQEAATLVTDMEERINAITARTAALPEDELVRTMFVVWHDPFMIAGHGSLYDELIRLCGGINIGADMESFATIDIETVLVADPQVIIVGYGMGSGENLSYEFLIEEERLAGTTARQNDAVCGVDLDITGRAGPRIVEAVELFATALHPELFD